jgi:hypothetical protein
MNRTTKKLKAIEKRLSRDLEKRFGMQKLIFFGNMHSGNLTIVVTGKERK